MIVNTYYIVEQWNRPKYRFADGYWKTFIDDPKRATLEEALKIVNTYPGMTCRVVKITSEVVA